MEQDSLSVLRMETERDAIFARSVLKQLREGYALSSALEMVQINAFLEASALTLDKYEKELVDDPEPHYTRKRRGKRYIYIPSSLQAARDKLVSHMDAARALTSPIRKLPADVLYEIFQHSIDELEITIDRTPSCSTLKLTWICAFWRKLITACPTFWSSMSIEADRFRSSSKHVHLALFRHYISLSGNALLSFSFISSRLSHRNVHTAMDVLLDHVNRWHRVHLRISDDRWLQHFSEKLDAIVQSHEGETALLTRLDYLNIGGQTWPMQLFVKGQCPNLRIFQAPRSLTWTRFCLFDFSRLQKFQAGIIRDNNSIPDLLTRMPQLEEFILVGRLGDDLSIPGLNDDLTGSAPARQTESRLIPCYSNITTLSVSLRCLWPKAWKNVLLPSLKILNVSQQLGSHTELSTSLGHLFNELCKMLLHSNCTLQTASFYYIPAQCVLDFLLTHSTISHLEFAGDFQLESYCRILGHSSYAGSTIYPLVAPNLCTLSLDQVSISGMHCSKRSRRKGLCSLTESICSMLESRLINILDDAKVVQALKKIVLGKKLSCLDSEVFQQAVASMGVAVEFM